MGNIRKGRWTERFQDGSDYESELLLAVEVSHQLRCLEKQVVIELERIPGWLAPLWAVDENWLYIRRPEGVWKTRLPSVPEDVPIVLRQRFSSDSVRGNEYLGRGLCPTEGWMIGPDEPKSPLDLDNECSPEAFEVANGVAADEMADPLFRVFEDTASRYVMHAGELFDRPPSVSFDGNWVICQDVVSGRRVAYGVDSHPCVRQAIKENRLCLYFSGSYIDSMIIRVSDPEAI